MIIIMLDYTEDDKSVTLYQASGMDGFFVTYQVGGNMDHFTFPLLQAAKCYFYRLVRNIVE